MNEVSKRFEQLVKSTYKKFLDQGTILPERTEQGIKVGDVLIVSDGPYKDIVKNGTVLYRTVCLNAVAIRLANLAAWNKQVKLQQELFGLDQKYSKYFTDSKIYLNNYHRAVNSNDEIRAEILWTRYEDAKERAIILKDQAENLARFEQ
jgi:hypothetical protein